MNRRIAFAAAALAALSGCSTLDKRIEGWPQLTVRHHTDFAEVASFCWDHMSPAQRFSVAVLQPLSLLPPVPLGCALVDWSAGTCDAYYHAIPDTDDPIARAPSEAVRDHELRHCQGWDHGGVLQRAFDAWRASHIGIAQPAQQAPRMAERGQ